MSRCAERVIVVGAGVAGLAAAHRLAGGGCEVTVLEAEDHLGGKTAASRREGFTLNRGASVLGGSYREMIAIAREIGVADQLAPIAPVIGVRADGRTYRLRGAGAGALIDFATTGLLRARSKRLAPRLAADALRARRAAGFGEPALRAGLDTESVRSYCERRLDRDWCDRLLAPLLGSLYVIDGAEMSVADLFFSLSKFLAGGILSYRGGIDFFARALGAALDVRLGARVAVLEPVQRGVRVVWEAAGAQHEQRVDGVVLTVPAPDVVRLCPSIDPGLAGMLGEIQTANLIGARFALRRRPEEPALVIAVPPGEPGGLSSVLFEHNVCPDCAPPGKGVVGAFSYHEWSTPRLGSSDEELLAELAAGLEAIVPGIAQEIEFGQLSRWTPGALRSHPGQHRLIARIDAAVERLGRVQLAGDYLTIPSVNGSVLAGEVAAARLTGAMRAAAGSARDLTSAYG
jgi:oxygen-dependent protoporphyrinogen oxidase